MCHNSMAFRVTRLDSIQIQNLGAKAVLQFPYVQIDLIVRVTASTSALKTSIILKR